MLVSHPQETRMTPPFEPGGPWNVIEFPRSAIRYRTSPPPTSTRLASLAFLRVAWLLHLAAAAGSASRFAVVSEFRLAAARGVLDPGARVARERVVDGPEDLGARPA